MKKWMKQFEETKKKWKNLDNLIEAFKYKYENENHLFEWFMGISIALFLSVSLGNLTKSGDNTLIILGYTLYTISLLALFTSSIFYIILRKRQKYVIINLYKEKEK